MSGLISQRGNTASSALNNPLLNAADQKIESQIVDPATQANYNKIVVAGMHVALAKGPDGLLASLQHSQDPISDCAKAAVALVLILRKDAKGVMPLKAMVPAAMSLMLKALDFADRSGIAKVGTAELDRATTIFTNTIFARLHITPQMLQHAGMKVHAITQDPTAMEAVNRKAGIVKHPMASEPTPLPPA